MNVPTLIIPGQSVTVMLPGKTLTAKSDHPKFADIITLLGEPNGDTKVLESLFDLAKPVREYVGLNGKLTVVNGAVLFNGVPVHNYTTEKILQFMELGLPVSPIINFLERLLNNPSKRAVEELYRFLVHRNMPLTHDGKFRAYKGVRSDYMDKYTGTVSHHIGAKPTMLRNEVNDDARVACSNGFHAGSLNYANDYAGPEGRLMVVEIDPADVVSVPFDCDGQKLRTASYLVVDELKDRSALPDTYIPAPADESDDSYGDDDEPKPFADDPCVDCGDETGECGCGCPDCGEHPNDCQCDL
ncbi:MAG: hypothetical protein EBT92_16230 [Planctomycetes bacterium]|nr:hypothetical protein [Planctomycetota bacterium]